MKDVDYDFCDVYGNVCFDKVMADNTLKENCNCPMECESISYSSYYVSFPFDPEELCSKQTDGLMEEFLENHRYPPQIIRKFEEFVKDNVTSDAFEICKKNVHYLQKTLYLSQ